MIRTLAILAGLMTLAPPAAWASAPQTLGIVLHSGDAATERQPHYQAARPIAVNVAGDARRFDAVTVTAHGPDGSAITAPLARSGDGFTGYLRLVTPGTWTIALTTQIGDVSADVANVPLDVVPAAHVRTLAFAVMLLAALSTSCGVLLVLRYAFAPIRIRN